MVYLPYQKSLLCLYHLVIAISKIIKRISNFLLRPYLLKQVYWKEKETHIHFGCYLYQRCINCLNESLFEMLNIHFYTHCETFLCTKITCVSHVNGKSDRGYQREIQTVLNNRKM